MSDEKKHGSHDRETEKHQNPEKNQEQQRRAPGSEQEYQGDQSNQRRGNLDHEHEEKEPKRA